MFVSRPCFYGPRWDYASVEYLRVDAAEGALNGTPDKKRGVIVDSGTTDTYLPQALTAAFDEAWKRAPATNKIRYHNNPVEMTPEKLHSLPTILLVLQGRVSSNENTNENAIGLTRSHEDLFHNRISTLRFHPRITWKNHEYILESTRRVFTSRNDLEHSRYWAVMF